MIARLGVKWYCSACDYVYEEKGRKEERRSLEVTSGLALQIQLVTRQAMLLSEVNHSTY